MSWFSSVVSIDERIEKATSESLPSGEQDLALNLEICDLIRSKTVPPKDAMRSLKKRLNHKNPNVQLLTLHLIDICIKNGGSHFLTEIASREFMDSFVSVLQPSSGLVNRDVKELMLEYLQNWANAFEGQIQLVYVNKVYEKLKKDGFHFPSGAKISSSFIDSSAPPEWVDADECMECNTPFSFVNRKHHCRNCGGVYIQKHCNNYTTLPHYGINQPVRVCDSCFNKLRGSSSGGPSSRVHNSNDQVRSHTTSNNRDLSSVDDDNDSDLQRALKLSLEESQNPGLTKPSPNRAPTNHLVQNDDDDEDMKAAIAASLRDMENEGKAIPSGTDTTNPSNNLYQLAPPSVSIADVEPKSVENTVLSIVDDEFTSVDAEIIHRYVQIVESLQRNPSAFAIRDTKLELLHNNVLSLRPKLSKDLRRTVEKCDQLEDLHGKLTAIVRYYDKLLEDRFSYSMKKYGHMDEGNQYTSSVVSSQMPGGQYHQYQTGSGPVTYPEGNSPYYPPVQDSDPHYGVNTETYYQQQHDGPLPSEPPLPEGNAGYQGFYPALDERGNISQNQSIQDPDNQSSEPNYSKPGTKEEEEPILIEL
ncbi:ESCRT-0 subunit protein VPS27 [Sugiyamaella lignohabitans]|uniref:Vacuolar protein sorting-associated protein 27 n=1 Tax=Sugiyamaella lignohabitans TaxID=796027 RepID=A0A167C393_9ASCO|nr:ESCRT-0 subunit protein VPS27 [Sugiyamaella lignohabitans]ANB11165.1 ESCRT-0 subunit protein VPS27 [Sugiyamaella lignohabitans]